MAFDILKNSQSFFTKAVLILLALTFVIGFGYVGSPTIGGGGPGAGIAADVNGDKIPMNQFHRFRDRLLDRLRREGQDISDDMMEYIDSSAIDMLVNEKLLAQKARELGIRVSDEEFNKEIWGMPWFQLDGSFVGRERYKEIVRKSFHITPKNYEDSVRDSLVLQKLVSVLQSSVTASDEELLSIHRTQEEKIDLHYASFAAGDYLSDEEPGEDEIVRYYEERSELFWEPERRKARYAKLSPSDFVEEVQVSEEEIAAYYNTFRGRGEFDTAGAQKTLSEVKEEIRNKRAMGKASALYDRFLEEFLSGKRTFSDLLSQKSSLEVRESSEFTAGGSGGDIPGAVRRQAFSAEKGRLSNVVLKDFTWFFEVTHVDPSKRSAQETVRGEIVSALKKRKAVDLARDSAEKSLAGITAAGGRFDKAARSLGVPVLRTGFFTRSGNPLGVKSPDFAYDAFTLSDGRPTSGRVYRSGDTFYVVSLAERKEVESADIGSIKEELRQREVSAREEKVLESLLESLREKAKIKTSEDIIPREG